jgi:hypothetical protein
MLNYTQKKLAKKFGEIWFGRFSVAIERLFLQNHLVALHLVHQRVRNLF